MNNTVKFRWGLFSDFYGNCSYFISPLFTRLAFFYDMIGYDTIGYLTWILRVAIS